MGMGMMDGIEIVPFQREMARALYQIETACFSDPWRPEDFLSAADTPGQVFFAARDCTTGEVIGFGGLWHILDEGDVLNLAVLPAYRRRGIGRALLNALCGYADTHGIAMLFLEVRCGNAAAIALYRAFGFTPYGTRAAYYKNPREDAVLMRRSVPPKPAEGIGD